MKLRAFGFSANGQLRRSIAAIDDCGDPLGWEHLGNWSNTQTRERAIRDLATTVGISEDKARKAVADALREARQHAGFPDDDAVQRPLHSLPIIDLTDKQPREIAEASWNVLRRANAATPQFFTFGNLPTHLEHDAGGPYLSNISLAGMRGHLNTRADYIRMVRGDERAAIVPHTTLEEMLATARLPLPKIKGVSHSPVLAPTGEIIVESGYSPSLELYLQVLQMSPIPERVSRDDVDRALTLLLDEFLGDFRFAMDADRANTIGLLLTPLVRPTIDGRVPLYDIEAPTPGTGKGLLANVVGILATGASPTTMTEARDEDEWRKRITAALRQAPPMILIDNVRRKVDSAHLSAVLTAPMWMDREMGKSQALILPNVAVWLITANNPSFSNEMSRRIVCIRLDAVEERPWERTGFRHDRLDHWVRNQRGVLLNALLTLVRAWLREGRPAGNIPMGGFESYAAIIGGILHVAGIPGFLDNRAEVYAQVESESAAWQALFEAWWEAYKDQRVDMEKVFGLAKEKQLLTELRSGRTDRGARTALGQELSGRRDRIVGGYTVRVVGTAHGGGALYRLEVKKGTGKGSPGSPRSPGAKAEEW